MFRISHVFLGTIPGISRRSSCTFLANHQMVRDMPAEKITEYLFIAARGVTYDWRLHDGGYDLEKAMRAYMGRLLKVFLQ